MRVVFRLRYGARQVLENRELRAVPRKGEVAILEGATFEVMQLVHDIRADHVTAWVSPVEDYWTGAF